MRKSLADLEDDEEIQDQEWKRERAREKEEKKRQTEDWWKDS